MAQAEIRIRVDGPRTYGGLTVSGFESERTAHALKDAFAGAVQQHYPGANIKAEVVWADGGQTVEPSGDVKHPDEELITVTTKFGKLTIPLWLLETWNRYGHPTDDALHAMVERQKTD